MTVKDTVFVTPDADPVMVTVYVPSPVELVVEIDNVALYGTVPEVGDMTAERPPVLFVLVTDSERVTVPVKYGFWATLTVAEEDWVW